MLESEERLVPYLFKLRHTAEVKALVQRMTGEGSLWQDCRDGWQALESSLRLTGWNRELRIILVSEAPSRTPIAEADLVCETAPAALANRPSPMRKERGRIPRPRHGVARSPCWSHPLMSLHGPPSPFPDTIGTGRMPRIVLMS